MAMTSRISTAVAFPVRARAAKVSAAMTTTAAVVKSRASLVDPNSREANERFNPESGGSFGAGNNKSSFQQK